MLATVACLCVSLGSISAQTRESVPEPPARSDAGSWDGTWYHVSRDYKIALWLRSVDGHVEMRWRYFHNGSLEGFDTAWSLQTDYVFSGALGRFELTLDEADAATIRGGWNWRLAREDQPRRETVKFRLYRILDGRTAVLVFDEYERVVGVPESEIPLPRQYQWAFIKASNRQVRWDELPF